MKRTHNRYSYRPAGTLPALHSPDMPPVGESSAIAKVFKRQQLWRWVIAVLLLIGGISDVGAEVRYVYDEVGRLVLVVAPNGESALYRYDALGNILAIQRYAAGELAIAEFTPDHGPLGTIVTLYGVGFSPTIAENLVTFNYAIRWVRSGMWPMQRCSRPPKRQILLLAWPCLSMVGPGYGLGRWSSSASLGAQTLTALCGDLEAKGQGHDTHQASALLAAIQ